MANPPLGRGEAEAAVRAVRECLDAGFKISGRPSAVREAAQRIQMQPETLRCRVRTAERTYGITVENIDRPKPPEIEFPHFPDEDIPIERIIDLHAERFEKRMASYEAHTWFPIKINDRKPIGIVWFGDPHLDDNGANWPELKKHIAVCKSTDGVYGANIGDSTNNWAGRLVRLYAEQDTSVKTARRMAEWFMLDSGVRWMVWLLGNHDSWGDGSAVLAQMAKRHGTHKLVCHNWEARFSLLFPNGWQPRIYASHDFKGNSIWNPMHGPMREGQIGEDADLYVCGHKHTAGEMGFENVSRGRYQRFLRVRGFKFMDDYARVNGYKEQATGCSAMAIFDPGNQSTSIFMDVEEGAAFLTWKRSRA